MLGINLRGVHLVGNSRGCGQYPLEALSEGQLDVSGLAVEIEHLAHLPPSLGRIAAILLGEHGRYGPLGVAQGDAILLQGGSGVLRSVDNAEEHDLGAHRRLALRGGFVLRRHESADAFFRHALEQHI